MHFQVNDETYFLSLAEDERRWCFSVSTPNGERLLPVYVDVPESNPLIVIEEPQQQIPN